jgi:hypothetical protein
MVIVVFPEKKEQPPLATTATSLSDSITYTLNSSAPLQKAVIRALDTSELPATSPYTLNLD